jgi:hypothetical protein
MELFSKKLNKQEIFKRIGDISQLGGIKKYIFSDGVSSGMRAIDIKTPGGLDLTILPDRGMDISNFFYKSIPLCWKSSTRETSPSYYNNSGYEWLKTFFGGFLTTCGLLNTGPPNTDEGEELGLHGRISNISAYNVNTFDEWKDDEYCMFVEGRVREASVFGNKLELYRKVTVPVSEPKIIIEDTVENIGHKISPLMILYHINIGYPVIDENAELIEGKADVIPRDEEAKNGFKEFNRFSEPVKDYKEKVYYHDIESDSEGNSNIAIVNDSFNNKEGLGILLKFNKDNLPYLAQWKQLGTGEYVCGIEPCNNFAMGRKTERETGRLKFIEPGQKIKLRLEAVILKSNYEIKKLKQQFVNLN